VLLIVLGALTGDLQKKDDSRDKGMQSTAPPMQAAACATRRVHTGFTEVDVINKTVR
jgi:hypothetical protein